jgi:hypothetical protein
MWNAIAMATSRTQLLVFHLETDALACSLRDHTEKDITNLLPQLMQV